MPYTPPTAQGQPGPPGGYITRERAEELASELAHAVEGDGAFAGGTFDWATPFAFLCGLSLIAGYGLLGATWLAVKAEGPVGERARSQAKMLLLAVLVFMAAVSLWTPLAQPRIAERWFSLPNFYFHLTTAYNILRHNGVELGKMDYLGRS